MALALPILDREHIRPGDRLCVALSGGADSVALLLLVAEENALPRNALGCGLSAVHVHHGIRGDEADADAKFVEELCARLGVPLRVHRTSVPERLAIARERGEPETLEEAARHERYALFHELVARGERDVVLTAHTLEDQAETVMMKLLRGAWTEGLAGIAPVVLAPAASPFGDRTAMRDKRQIVRPILHIRREELRDYLHFKGQSWREDASNADLAHTRNRMRHQIMPVLRKENPSFDQTLANLATLAREEEARWEAELARILPQVLLPGTPVRGGGRAVASRAEPLVALELERLRGMDLALRRRVLRAAARSLGVRLSYAETGRLLRLAGMGTSESRGRVIELSQGLAAERSLRELRLQRRDREHAGEQAADQYP